MCTYRHQHVKGAQGWVWDQLHKTKGFFHSLFAFADFEKLHMINLTPYNGKQEKLLKIKI